MRKTVHYIILFATACLLFAACSRRTTDARRLLACIDSLADVNPDSADMLLRAIPDSALQKGEENLGRVELLLRIKTDDKLYRPVTHYRDTILQLIDYFEHHPKVLQAPVDDSPIVAAPWIGLIRLGDSGVSVVTRSWCKGPDYWEVYFNLNETVYQMLKERGFMFPFNRVDVNILNNK